MAVCADRFDDVLGAVRGRGGSAARPDDVPAGCVLAGPAPYSWYALVDPDTLEHDDSLQSAESAHYINEEYQGGRMVVVGMSGPMADRSLGRIFYAGHEVGDPRA